MVKLIESNIDLDGNVSIPVGSGLTLSGSSPVSTAPTPIPIDPTHKLMRELIEKIWNGNSDDIDYLLQQHIDGIDVPIMIDFMTSLEQEHTRSNFDKFVNDNT